ncbi:purine-nucleoside phosphorylase, partial [Arthrobacter deserti]|nr:purine-nucleoside phosphorylase [Arthrobacter deserti]
MTTDPFALAAEAAAFIAGETGVGGHDVGLVLGSGWGGAAGVIGGTTHSLPAARVPGFSAPAVQGHPGT